MCRPAVEYKSEHCAYTLEVWKMKNNSDKMNSILVSGVIILIICLISGIRFLVQAFQGVTAFGDAIHVGLILCGDGLLMMLAGAMYQRFRAARGIVKNSTVNTYFLGMVLAGIFLVARSGYMEFIRLDFFDEEAGLWDTFFINGAGIFLIGTVFSSTLMIKRYILKKAGTLFLGFLWFAWTAVLLTGFARFAFGYSGYGITEYIAYAIPVVWLGVPVFAAATAHAMNRR